MVTKEMIDNLVYPAVFIGDAVVDFKKIFTGYVNSIQSLDELREFVAYYNNIPVLDRVLVLEDISFLPKGSEGTLLKFVEETSLKLILLSRFDKMSNIMLSRIKTVVKYYKEGVSSQFLPVSRGYTALDEALKDTTSYYDRVRYIGKLSPKIIFLESNVRQSRNRSKIVSFVD